MAVDFMKEHTVQPMEEFKPGANPGVLISNAKVWRDGEVDGDRG